MFNNKKFLAALLCTPLFGACVVDGDDDGADTGSGTDPGTSTASTTMSTTDNMTTSASTTTEATTTTSPTTGETETETETADTSAGSTTETGAAGMACFQSCVEAVDCCGGEPMCEAGLGEYPYAWSCEADGTCAFGGCTSDEQCTLGGVLPEYVCADVEGFAICQPGCAEDMDCEDQFLMGWTCSGDGGAAGSYCEPPGCTADKECGPTGTCEADGTCSFPPCESDDDCADDFGGSICDVETGFCTCAVADDCPEGYTCAAL